MEISLDTTVDQSLCIDQDCTLVMALSIHGNHCNKRKLDISLTAPEKTQLNQWICVAVMYPRVQSV